MELPELSVLNISIVVILRGQMGPVLSEETRQSQLWRTLIWPLYWLLLTSVSDWLLDHLHLKHQHPFGIILPYKEMWLCKENGKIYLRLFIHQPDGTQMWFSTLMRHRSGFFKPLELNWALSHHNPRTFFSLCTAALAAQEGGNLHPLIAAETGFSRGPLHKQSTKWFSSEIHDNDEQMLDDWYEGL